MKKYAVLPALLLALSAGAAQAQETSAPKTEGQTVKLAHLLSPSATGKSFYRAGGQDRRFQGFSQGMRSWDVSFFLSFEDDFIGNFAGSLGFFISEQMEWGGRLELLFGDDIDTQGFIGVFLRWYMASTTDTVPYLEGRLGTTFGTDDDVFTLGGAIGIQHFVTPLAAIFAELFVDWTDDDTDWGIMGGVRNYWSP